MDKYYKYTLEANKTFYFDEFKNVKFENEWVYIYLGEFTVKKGYSWDGCSPKYEFKLFGKTFVIGTPDGKEDQLKDASLVHDAICQFRDEIYISKEESLLIFDRELKAAKWKLRKLYVWAVDKFGPQNFLKE